MGLTPPDFTRGDIIAGPVRIIDGDTVEIAGRRILFYGIDAPEIDQSCRIYGLEWPCGERARIWLQRLVMSGPVHCLPVDDAPADDRAGDVKAMCFNRNNLNLNAAMVGDGLATYNAVDGDRFERAAYTARVNRKGMWAGRFVDPAEWRRGARLGRIIDRRRRRLEP